MPRKSATASGSPPRSSPLSIGRNESCGGSRGGNNGNGSRERDENGRFVSDDDRGGRGGRSGGNNQGGWFGDSRGHSEAARRGWESRH